MSIYRSSRSLPVYAELEAILDLFPSSVGQARTPRVLNEDNNTDSPCDQNISYEETLPAMPVQACITFLDPDTGFVY